MASGTTVETEKTRAGLEMLQAGIIQAVGLTGAAAVADTVKAAKGTVLWRDRTGKTRDAIVGEWQGSSRRGFVRAGGASVFLENGTRAHEIWGRPMLRFVVNGTVMYRRMVKHPGTQPRPFMKEARAIGERAAQFYGERFVSAAIRRARA